MVNEEAPEQFEQVPSKDGVVHVVNKETKGRARCGIEITGPNWGERFTGPLDKKRRCFSCERAIERWERANH
jgi:hypothetical protein